MEQNMDEFDESITINPEAISYLAELFNVPEEEIANIKYAMGEVIGKYENTIESCTIENNLGTVYILGLLTLIPS